MELPINNRDHHPLRLGTLQPALHSPVRAIPLREPQRSPWLASSFPHSHISSLFLISFVSYAPFWVCFLSFSLQVLGRLSLL